ncbi:hypothetical protein FE249_06965 [Acidiphilium multivorum]|uniref:hypothetical protein n=1 Tax=Acidiphilium multivorum TaxID=62140 RepID=UPI001F4C3740|nr:hypothetical protein [Acidiphilium multivorum]UNC13975.1 hypothetical protein FE249_06965 [Acidiphilium multivorum]
MADWREKLRRIRNRISMNSTDSSLAKAVSPEISAPRAKAATAPSRLARESQATRRPPRDVGINLGIDFGTSFTKVCFRDVGAEESGIVAVGKAQREALLPSVVAIDDSGLLFLGDEVSHGRRPIEIGYLKMRLAGSPIGGALPVFDGIDLNSQTSIRALGAWFLASAIIRSQEWMKKAEKDRLKNRTPVWSANVGVPVEHCDSELLTVFEEVLGVAWQWVKKANIPSTIQDAVSAYPPAAESLGEQITDFHAVPEIAAAVQSFVMSREAVPGLYVYFDVGGGTVDGVVFKYLNNGGERHINFYSGKVAPLGVSAIGASLAGADSAGLDVTKLEALLKGCPKAKKCDLVKELRKLVGKVIIDGKGKDPSSWQQDAVQNADYSRKFVGSLSCSRTRPLIVFIGGGGSKSEWYRATIESTYIAFKQYNAGIPPYKLFEVPPPTDLALDTQRDGEFFRFAISYGLSIPIGEGPEVGLPSQFAKAEPAPRWCPPDRVDYADSKDVYG